MQKRHDIYRKEEPPKLAGRKNVPRAFRREWRKNYKHDREGGASSAYPPTSPGHGGRRRMFDDQESHHHHRRRKSQGASLANRLLWGSATLLIIGYISFLVYSKLAESRKESALPKVQAPPPKPPEEVASPSGEPSIATPALQEKIESWKGSIKSLSVVEDLIEQRNLDKAHSMLQDMIEKTPKNLEAKVALAGLHMVRKEYSDAERILLEVLAVTPKKFEAKKALATILQHQNNYRGSIALAYWILEEDELDLDMHNLAARSYLKLGEVSKAITHYSKVVTLDPLDSIAANNLAQAFVKNQNFEKAEKIFKNLLKQDNVESRTYFNLAVCYANMNRTVEAVDLLSQAAGLFGESWVKTWIHSEEFAPIREKTSFKRFKKELLEGGGGAISEEPSPDQDVRSGKAEPETHGASGSV